MFFTGDFNGGEKEKYYSIITSGGMLDAKYIAKVSASVGLFSFHPVIGALPDDSRSPIDHIFVTPNVTAVSYTHLDVYKRQLQYCEILKLS